MKLTKDYQNFIYCLSLLYGYIVVWQTVKCKKKLQNNTYKYMWQKESEEEEEVESSKQEKKTLMHEQTTKF